MTKKQLSKLLSDNLEYYYNDTSKRCVDANSSCSYSGITLNIDTEGCFVGKLLSPELRLELDQEFPNESDWTMLLEESTNIEKIPKWMITHSRLLNKFQTLHDSNTYWNLQKGKELSEQGKIQLQEIIDVYELNINNLISF